MKLILLLLLLSFPLMIIAQTSFENVYSEFCSNAEGLKIKETTEGNYIVAASIDSILTEITFDQNGNILNKRSFTDIDYKLVSVDFTNDDGYVMIYYIKDISQKLFFVLKLNNNLQIDWYKYLFSNNDKDFIISITSTSKNKVLLSYSNSDSEKLNVIYLDETGKEEWKKSINGDGFYSDFARYPIFELMDNSFLVSSRNSVIKVDQSGDSLWSYTTGIVSDIDQSESDSTIYISSSNGIVTKLYQNGDLFQSSEGFGRGTNSISLFEDNSIVLYVNALNYQIINSSLETVSERTTKLKINDIKTNGDIFFGIGSYTASYYSFIKDKNICLIKGDKNYFPEKHLTLLSPNGGEIYPSEDSYYTTSLTVETSYENITSLKTEFSSDNGANWEILLIDTELVFDYYKLDLPVVNSDKCLIRISDLNDPTIFDKSYSPFSVRMYRYYDYIAGNECKMWIGNSGMSSHNPFTDDSGFYWPGGEATIPAIFVDGIVWGGIHDGLIKVNGSTYRYGLMPGAILDDGTRDDPSKLQYSIFKLKKDWQSLPPGDERDLMEYNYNNWPGEHGAPFNDLNNDRIFTKGVDEPEIIGDETLFYVANDLDSERTAFAYGSLPIGIEFQQTLFAYNTPELKNAVFKRIRLINKSNSQIDSMYIGYFADDDLGDAGDDYSGCDTLLNLAYTFNGDNNDEDFYGLNPPAVGRVLLQGAVVKGEPEDSAKYKGRRIQGFRNLSMTSHQIYISCTGTLYEDPELGTKNGTFHFYKNLKGVLWNGDPIIDPNTGDTTKLMLDGDPVKGTGWYEGDGWPGGPTPNDRRSLMSSGYFTIAPGDTQEVVYAIFMARGSDNIQSIAELKKSTRVLHEFWGNDIPTTVSRETGLTPLRFSLSQNYPNPFNPTTTIEYQIPDQVRNDKISLIPSGVEGALIELIVYDILGREVTTLVNQKQKPGQYEITFDASKYSSGIYFYRLKTEDFIQTKKMMFLK